MSRRPALLGAVLGPLVWSGYLLVVGVSRLPEPVGPSPSSLPLWGIYLGAAAGIGLLVGWSATRLRVTATVLPVSVAFLPWTVPHPVGTLFLLNYHLLFLLVAGTVLAVAEYGFRHPGRLDTVVTRRALVFGVVAGTVHLGIAVWLRTVVFGFGWGGGGLVTVFLVAWMGVGALLTGGVPGLLYGRFRLVSPLLVVGLGFAWSAVETWRYLQDLAASGAAMGVAFTPFTLYLVAWFAVLAVALLAGGLEYRVRTGGLRSVGA